MKLYKHQQIFLDKLKAGNAPRLLVWECGSGKSIAGCLWLKEMGIKVNLVVCPKQVVKKWEQELKNWGTTAMVLSKEEFKKFPIKAWDNIIIDEADTFASPLFMKGRSQLTSVMYETIRTYSPQTLLLTATPIRSNPNNLHTLLAFAGIYIEWKKWRDHFFELRKMPYLPRPAWLPKSNWRQLIRPALEKYADIILLKDCVGEVPEITHTKVPVKSEKFDGTEWEPTKAFFEEHRHEQKNKPKHIIDIAKGYRKVLVVAYYVEQVEALAKELKKDRETFHIHGGVKGHEEIIEKAKESDECFIIIQASIGAGFDLNGFSCVIFASMSYAVRDFVQMSARVKRIHDLHPVAYHYLLAGRCDKAILHNVELGRDFVPALWKQDVTTTK